MDDRRLKISKEAARKPVQRTLNVEGDVSLLKIPLMTSPRAARSVTGSAGLCSVLLMFDKGGYRVTASRGLRLTTSSEGSELCGSPSASLGGHIERRFSLSASVCDSSSFQESLHIRSGLELQNDRHSACRLTPLIPTQLCA